jgi:hypothetical protein
VVMLTGVEDPMSIYKQKQWLDFRRDIIKLDGGRCRQCGRSEKNGVVLQVHHKIYIRGKFPWQYAPTDCETLCQGCHAQTHGKIKPTFGWDLLGSDDLGDLSGQCDFCGTELRYTFLIARNCSPW